MITIEAAKLARAMKNAAGVTESRNTIPILANVLLRADGGALEIVTSNLDLEYCERVPLAQPGELATTVDASRLSALASVADKDAQISLDLEDNRLTVKCGRSRWAMPVLPIDDFPRLSFDAGGGELEVPGKELARMLGRVLWSICDEEARYYLAGPLLHGEDGRLALAATNCHTLARDIGVTEWPDDAPEVILMPKWSRFVERLAGEADTVTLAWDSGKARASAGAVTLTGKVIQGQFPDYRRVIPTVHESVVTVDPSALREAIRRSTVLAIEKTRAVKFERIDSMVRVSCTSPDTGTACAEIPADCEAGHATGFNARYLGEALAVIGGDSATLNQAKDANAPALLRRVVDDGALVVVMPCRV